LGSKRFHIIQYILIGSGLLSLGATTEPVDVTAYKLVMQPTSSLTIDGKTNVNTFQCSFAQYAGADTLVFKRDQGDGVYFLKGDIRLQASGFDCGKKVMTRDFQKVIKAEAFPHFIVELLSFEKMPEYNPVERRYKGAMKIFLAGESSTTNVECTFRKDKAGLIHLTGSQEFTFSDFKMTPPTRLMGAIKVENRIVVRFHWVLVQA